MAAKATPKKRAIASKKVPPTITVNGKKISTVIWDRIFDTPKGVIRFYLELTNTMETIRKYQKHLCHTRRIPMSLQVLPGDPRILEVSKLMPWENNPLESLAMTYGSWRDDAENEAMILTMANVPENKWEFIPSPYAPDFGGDLMGGIELPSPERNLNHPTERRLKQIMDILESDPTVLSMFESEFEVAAKKFYRLVMHPAAQSKGDTDEDGFRS